MSRFELIAAECASHDVTRMAQLLGVSTSGYYKHLHTLAADEVTPRVQRRRDLEVKILACPGCGRVIHLHRPIGGKWLCRNCTAKSRAQPCARCERFARPPPATNTVDLCVRPA